MPHLNATCIRATPLAIGMLLTACSQQPMSTAASINPSPVPALSGPDSYEITRTYIDSVAHRVSERMAAVPQRADLQRGGSAVVKLAISSDGTIVDTAIKLSSGSSAVDRQILATIALMPPLAPLPNPHNPPSTPLSVEIPASILPAAIEAPHTLTIPELNLAQGARQPSGNATVRPGRIPPSYFNEIQAIIARNIVYPASALRAYEQGTVKLRVRIKVDGTILSTILTQSSGHADLDVESLSLLHRLGTLPQPPNVDSDTVEIEFSFPIEFSLG